MGGLGVGVNADVVGLELENVEKMEGGAEAYRCVEHISSCPDGESVGSKAEGGEAAWKCVRQGCSSLEVLLGWV